MSSAVYLTFLSGVCTFIGGIIGTVIRGKSLRFLGSILSMSAGIMIALSATEILPHAYSTLSMQFGGYSILVMALFFVIGALLIITMNIMTDFEEHSLYRLGVFSMIALIAHNIPEGMAIYLTAEYDINLGLPLALGVAMHNIPEGIAIALPVSYSKGAFRGLLYSLVASLSEPIGAFMGMGLKRSNLIVTDYLLTIVAGMMVYLCISEIMPKAMELCGKRRLFIGFVVGNALMMVMLLLLNI